MMGVNYYEDVQRVSGALAWTSTSVCSWCRGMFHCGGGLGVSRVDYRQTLIDWVESGKVPERLVADRVVDGQTTMTRPLCPYPEVAKYDGQGDPRFGRVLRLAFLRHRAESGPGRPWQDSVRHRAGRAPVPLEGWAGILGELPKCAAETRGPAGDLSPPTKTLVSQTLSLAEA